jgi:hypothetical protein
MWTAADNLIYTGFTENFHVIQSSELLGARFNYYTIGVDWGDDHPTAIVLVGVMPGGEHVVVKEIYMRETAMTKVVQHVINLANSRPGIRSIYVDPSAKALSRLLREGGLHNVRNAVNDVEDGIETVRDMLEYEKILEIDENKKDA